MSTIPTSKDIDDILGATPQAATPRHSSIETLPNLDQQADKPKRVQLKNGQFVIESIDDLYRTAIVFERAGFRMIGSKSTTEKRCVYEIFTCLLMAYERGLPLTTALQSIGLIDNTFGIFGKVVMAMVMRSGLLVGMQDEWVGDWKGNGDDRGYRVTMTRKVDGGTISRTEEFTVQMARLGGLAGRNNWTKYPDAMCKARATNRLASVLFADVIGGMQVFDETEAREHESFDASKVRGSVASRMKAVENEAGTEADATDGG